MILLIADPPIKEPPIEEPHSGATQSNVTVVQQCSVITMLSIYIDKDGIGHNQCSEVGSARETFNPIRSGMFQTANDPGGGVCSNWNFSKIDNFTAVSK